MDMFGSCKSERTIKQGYSFPHIGLHHGKAWPPALLSLVAGLAVEYFLSAHSKEMERLIYRPLDPRCFKIKKQTETKTEEF